MERDAHLSRGTPGQPRPVCPVLLGGRISGRRRDSAIGRVMFACALAGWVNLSELGAESVAHWRFEAAPEPAAKEPKRGPQAVPDLVLVPPNAGLGPGRSGQALWPAGSPAALTPPTGLRIGGDGPRLAGVTNPTDTRLNLGADDWTLECWLWLEAGAAGEGVIYEIGAGPPGTGELVTRLSLVPREETFVLAGIVRVVPGEPAPVGREIEFNDPAGPPHGVARLEEVTLAPGAALPRARWFHVALVHAAGEGMLRLFLDGRMAAAAPARLTALPRAPAAYLSIGCDGRRARVLAGAIDELQVSDHAAYAREFTPSDPAPLPANP